MLVMFYDKDISKFVTNYLLRLLRIVDNKNYYHVFFSFKKFKLHMQTAIYYQYYNYVSYVLCKDIK